VRVLVIPEDPVHDSYVLKPIVERLFRELGKRARVDVLHKPRMKGIDQALAKQSLESVVRDHPMVNVFLVLVDRDGIESRAERAAAREAEHPNRLFVCLAVEEVEVWMLALYAGDLGVEWGEVRTDPHPKERFAEPLLKKIAPRGSIGAGRVRAMDTLDARTFSGLLNRCPELQDLLTRLQNVSPPLDA
jgi:hypothetical protein